MEDHKMHEPEEDQNGNIISIQGGRLRRIVFLNGFNRGEIETIFFFLLCNEFARLALSATIVRGHGCRSTSTVVNSLREDASHGGGSLLPSLARADTRSSLSLSLSPCVSPLSLLPLAPVNWCVGAGWTQITREEFRLSNPRWSCAPLSPLPRSLLLSFALFPVSSLIFLSSFLLLASSLLSRPLLLPLFVSHFFSPLANNNIFPTNIYILEINFFPFFFFSCKNSNSWNRFLIFPFLPFFFFLFFFFLFSSERNDRFLERERDRRLLLL